MIYRCLDGHISFSKEQQLTHCGMKGCSRSIDAISDIDVEWFYKISPDGLAINEKDLHMIIEDKNMPKEAKQAVKEAFPKLEKERKRFWPR
jgi:hypothetical protein